MQGFNMGRYIPPDEEGHTSANALHKKHPLGSRARNLHKTGALTVRFEMPFAVWCTTCTPETLIGQGVRFNAEKKKEGNYYSTPIYSFRMKHGACGGWIEIRTDPRETAYVVVGGGRRRDYGVDEGGGRVGEIRVVGLGEKGREGGGEDPFARIEGKVEDKRVAETEAGRILELRRRQDRDWEDPYEMSRRVRRGFRGERREREKIEAGREALRDKMSLGIEVLDESEGDRVRARMVDFGGEREAKAALRGRGIFEETKEKRRKGDVVAQRKALFRSELTGNTRAVVDPFLKDADTWVPEKRRKTATAKTRQDVDVGGDKDVAGIESDRSTSLGEQKKPASALVDYGSDSE